MFIMNQVDTNDKLFMNLLKGYGRSLNIFFYKAKFLFARGLFK